MGGVNEGVLELILHFRFIFSSDRAATKKVENYCSIVFHIMFIERED